MNPSREQGNRAVVPAHEDEAVVDARDLDAPWNSFQNEPQSEGGEGLEVIRVDLVVKLRVREHDRRSAHPAKIDERDPVALLQVEVLDWDSIGDNRIAIHSIPSDATTGKLVVASSSGMDGCLAISKNMLLRRRHLEGSFRFERRGSPGPVVVLPALALGYNGNPKGG